MKEDEIEVVCSVEHRSDGKLRLVVSVAESGSIHRDILTWRDFEARDFLDVTVPERDLADLGLLIVSRLAATCGGLKEPDTNH